MKHTNKIVALALALIMVLGLATTAFAAEGDTYTITINNSAAGHTYEAYQIFKGNISDAAENDDAAGTSAVLSDIDWGNGVTYTGDGVKVGTDEEGNDIYSKEATDIADALSDNTLNLEDLLEDLTLTTAAGTSTYSETNKNYVISGLTAGYYLVKDQDDSLNGDNDAYTKYIIEVIENSTVTPKSAVPEFQKKVKDINDSTGKYTKSTGEYTTNPDDNSTWIDSADYDIGDAVPFQLKGTVASDYNDYTNYYFAFHDVEEEGLTFQPDTVKVYVDGTLIASGYEVVTDTDDDCTFEVVFDNLKTITSVEAGSKITVEYKSILNEHANIGNKGNVNTAWLEFSNNPNETDEDEDEDHGKTPPDKVIVFTYKVVVNKVDKDNQPLAGAEFSLKKVLADGSEVVITTITAESGTSFSFEGLDDGNYVLSETVTPAGYNTIEDIKFTVTADHDIIWETQERTDVLNTLDGDVTTGEITFTASESEGSLTTDVVNQSGATLPETGGIGTTIFYVIGGVLVVGAAVLLVTKKRMASAK